MHDIHTHLYWKSYDADRDAVVSRAREAGVKEMFVIGCTIDESRQAIATAEQYPDMYAAVGVHPNELSKAPQGWIEELKKLAQHEKVVAIGECGLDYYSHDRTKIVTDAERALQKEGFLAQIALAQELDLPLVVHCRASVAGGDAYEDVWDILKANEAKKPTKLQAILHCYQGNTGITKQLLKLPNVFFSFTANITYPAKKAIVGEPARIAPRSGAGGDDLSETVKLIPLDRIFAETDCPFLAPQSKRGERNEPSFVDTVYGRIAEIQGQDISVVERAVEANVQKIFHRT